MGRTKHLVTMAVLPAILLSVCLLPANGWAGDDPVLKAVDTYLSDIHVKKYNVIKVDAVNKQRKVRPNLVILDVRKAEEITKLGKVPGALHIRLNTLAKSLDKLPKKDAAIIVYCKSGIRAAYATLALGLLGYTDLKVMDGGFEAWTKAGYEVEK